MKMTSTLLALLAIMFALAPLAESDAQTREGEEKEDHRRRPEYLSESEINMIRLWELPSDLSQASNSIVVPRDVLDELFERYADNDRVPKGKAEQRSFRSKKGWEQLELIFEIRARDLYSKVIIRQDPEPLSQYRRTINSSYIRNYFLPHYGRGQVEGLTLIGIDPSAMEEAYTNFYILSTATYEGRYFIDRDKPEDSLLLQWGLPRADAKFPAPEGEEAWRPYFRNTEDPRYQTYLEWIESLYPNPDYGISYQPPAAAEPADATN